MQIHPKTFEYLIKSYYYVGGYSHKYLLETLEVLPFAKKFNLEEYKIKERDDLNEETKKNHFEEWESIAWSFKEKRGKVYVALLEHIKSLNIEDFYKLLLVLFPDTNFKKMSWDSWNCQGEDVKDWHDNLIHYLNLCGIQYDSDKKQLVSSQEDLDIKKILINQNLIDIKFEDVFYRELTNEINKCYKIGSYTASFILSRKLLENLVIDILRQKYPQSQENLKLYCRVDNGKAKRFHDLIILIKNLDDKKEEFGIDKEIIEEFIKLIKPFRIVANSNTHSIIIYGNKDELDKLQIEKMAGLLIKLLRNF